VEKQRRMKVTSEASEKENEAEEQQEKFPFSVY
jgi:hypothetical protein